MNLPTEAVKIYEDLRATALNGNGSRSGLAMIIYHGMLHGLQFLTTKTTCIKLSPVIKNSASSSTPMNKALIQVLANMVLQSQAEVMHVF